MPNQAKNQSIDTFNYLKQVANGVQFAISYLLNDGEVVSIDSELFIRSKFSIFHVLAVEKLLDYFIIGNGRLDHNEQRPLHNPHDGIQILVDYSREEADEIIMDMYESAM